MVLQLPLLAIDKLLKSFTNLIYDAYIDIEYTFLDNSLLSCFSVIESSNETTLYLVDMNILRVISYKDFHYTYLSFKEFIPNKVNISIVGFKDRSSFKHAKTSLDISLYFSLKLLEQSTNFRNWSIELNQEYNTYIKDLIQGYKKLDELIDLKDKTYTNTTIIQSKTEDSEYWMFNCIKEDKESLINMENSYPLVFRTGLN